MMPLVGLHKFADVIFGITQKPLTCSDNFFYHAINLQVANLIQFLKNKKYNKTNTNKTQNLLKVIFRF